jgi:hypothetical protein
MHELQVQLATSTIQASRDILGQIETHVAAMTDVFDVSLEQHGEIYMVRCLFTLGSGHLDALVQLIKGIEKVSDITFGGSMRNAVFDARPNFARSLQPKAWQKQVWEYLHAENSQTTIHWIYDMTGKARMSEFVKHLSQTGIPRIVCESTKGIKSSVAKLVSHRAFVMDMLHSRGKKEGFCDTIEQIKIGHFYADDEVLLNHCPNIVVFAYFEPELPEPTQCEWIIQDVHELEDTTPVSHKRPRE